MTRDEYRYDESDDRDEPFVLADRGSDLARFYELAYQLGDHWISAYAHLKRALQLVRSAESIYRERIEQSHDDHDMLATIEIASFFPYFEERFCSLEPILAEILAILKLDELPTVFAVENDTPRHYLRRNYTLIMAHLVRDRIVRVQRGLLPLRLFDLCRRSEHDPLLEEVAELYSTGEHDVDE